MRQALQEVSAVLEIGRTSSGEIPASLISAAYRASRSTAIMFVLDSVSPSEIDQILDPLVARSGPEVCGVLYVNKSDDAAVLTSAAIAARVFAGSPDLRAKLSSRGIAYQDIAEAEDIFGESARQGGTEAA